MLAWIYKWLPIICGCHCRDDRSFWYKGVKFPVCARCTGEVAGVLLSVSTFWFLHTDALVSFCLILPLVFDGSLQALTKYESNNIKRVITGMLFGYGIVTLFFIAHVASFEFGYGVGKHLRA